MAKAIESGIAKMRIEEAAAKRQARIDSGKDIIIGVNSFLAEKDEQMKILEVDNTKVREQQIARLKKVKSSRNKNAVEQSLKALEDCASSGKGNLLERAMDA